MRLDIVFKDLQSRLSHFRRLGSFHENSFHELCRFPSASFTDEPLPPRISSRIFEAISHSLPHCTMERVHTQRRNVAYFGFHTRFTPSLSSGVKVLFQTGNTLGIIPLTKPSFLPIILSATGGIQEPEVSGMSSSWSALPQPCHFRFSKSFKR